MSSAASGNLANARNCILISHANPEDNAATIWFATQLSNQGYHVWADVIDLTGGEEFWGDIENVIRRHAAKVVFLFSAESNVKDGCQRELSVAQGVAKAEKLDDFVIPMRITDVPHNDANIRIHNLNFLESRSWNVGLDLLLKKLDKDGVPRVAQKGRAASAEWWRSRFATSRSVKNIAESLSSNWFRIRNPKFELYWHRIGQRDLGPIGAPKAFPWPHIEDSGGIWTFATAENTGKHLPDSLSVEKSVRKDFHPDVSPSQQERDVTFRLLVLATHQKLQSAGLLKYQLANDKHCFAFPKDLLEGDEIHFKTATGRSGHRTMVGYKTRIRATGSWKRIWHFAIQPIPCFLPHPVFMFRTHVLFSEEGEPLWTNAGRVQKARRNQCKNWWNDTWRDRLFAAAHWLSSADGAIHLDVGADAPILVDSEPIAFDCPVSYDLPNRGPAMGEDSEDQKAMINFLRDSIDDDSLEGEDEDGIEDDDDGDTGT